jgi:hypothetical protein
MPSGVPSPCEVGVRSLSGAREKRPTSKTHPSKALHPGAQQLGCVAEEHIFTIGGDRRMAQSVVGTP